ncbi:MAG TPA: fused MFS/spermidine synthase [Terriglobales bacterium]|nr:fused MFS/spermidine synthase [Terriglobales bacterium]
MQSVTAPCAERPAFAMTAALSLVGFSAVLGQIVLMRELIVVFNGNEISLGIMLATWLLWTAAGSSLANRFVRNQEARTTVAVLECLQGISLLPTLWILRTARTFFQTVPGELVGPVSMLLTSLGCLSAFCIFSGSLFVAAARMYQQERRVSDRVATSSAYLLEAAGSGIGGILASVVLLRFLDSFQIAMVVALVNLCMAAVLLFDTRHRQVVAMVLTVGIVALPLLIYVAPALDRSSLQHLWRGFQVLESRDSIYGNLAVIETGNIRSIYDNGVILATTPDEAAAEEAVHYALLEHTAPANVLLIGGGVNGSIAQALRHPSLERLDYVELDPALIEVARQFFPSPSAAFSDARVHLHYADGRHYLQMSGDKFDVIILDLPDPQTAQLNRFYTAEFFRSARDHLAAGGVLALQLRSSEDYISPELAEFLRCIHYTLRQVFPYSAIIPGEPIHFFAAMQPNVLADDPQTLISRLRERRLQTQYVREYFIPFRMMPDRMAQVHQLLQPLPATPVNRDFEPIAYYFDVVLWSAQFKLAYSRWFRAAAGLRFAPIVNGLLVVLLVAAVILAYLRTRQTRARASAAYCVAATGFTLMALQMFLLLAFQSVYGYVYHQLAILIAMFMAGMALGSWLGIRRIGSCDRPPFGILATTQFVLAASVPVLMFAVSVVSKSSATLLAAQFLFPGLAVSGGMLGGYQFPVATEIYLHGRSPKAGLGALYAIDLMGGCAAALVLSSYLIPVFGFWKTAWLSSAVNLAPALLAARVSLESKVSQA